MIITVSSTKGGPGKSTSSMYIAQALTAFGTVEVYDADPGTATATGWQMGAAEDGTPLDFDVVPANTRSIASLARSQRTDHVVIDTPPGHPDIIMAAMKAADGIIIPAETSGMDMAEVWKTMEMAGERPCAILLTKTAPRTRTYKAATAAIESERAPRFATEIRHREAIKASYMNPLSLTELFGYDEVLAELAEALGITLTPTSKENS